MADPDVVPKKEDTESATIEAIRGFWRFMAKTVVGIGSAAVIAVVVGWVILGLVYYTRIPASEIGEHPVGDDAATLVKALMESGAVTTVSIVLNAVQLLFIVGLLGLIRWRKEGVSSLERALQDKNAKDHGGSRLSTDKPEEAHDKIEEIGKSLEDRNGS